MVQIWTEVDRRESVASLGLDFLEGGRSGRRRRPSVETQTSARAFHANFTLRILQGLGRGRRICSRAKASVVSLHGLNSLKTRSHKLRFHSRQFTLELVKHRFRRTSDTELTSCWEYSLYLCHYLQCLQKRQYLTYRSIPSLPPTSSKPFSIASIQRRLDST